MWNIHRESQNIQNTYDSLFCFRYKTFITFLSLRFFNMRRERHNFFLSWLFHLPPPRVAPHRKLLVWPLQAPKIDFLRPSPNLNSLVRSLNLNLLTQPMCGHPVDPNRSRWGETKNWLPSFRLESQLTVFFKFQILSPSLLGMMSFTSLVLFPIWGIYCDICDCHIHSAHAWTPALSVCT